MCYYALILDVLPLLYSFTSCEGFVLPRLCILWFSSCLAGYKEGIASLSLVFVPYQLYYQKVEWEMHRFKKLYQCDFHGFLLLNNNSRPSSPPMRTTLLDLKLVSSYWDVNQYKYVHSVEPARDTSDTMSATFGIDEFLRSMSKSSCQDLILFLIS